MGILTFSRCAWTKNYVPPIWWALYIFQHITVLVPVDICGCFFLPSNTYQLVFIWTPNLTAHFLKQEATHMVTNAVQHHTRAYNSLKWFFLNPVLDDLVSRLITWNVYNIPALRTNAFNYYSLQYKDRWSLWSKSLATSIFITKKATRNEYGWQIVLVVGGLRERLNDSSVSLDSRINDICYIR